MRIVPAVDIRGGLCVNLVQGDYDKETVFSSDPVREAIRWRDEGAVLVHIVDLDGAKAGRCCIEAELCAMADAGVAFEVGGGIRNLETVRMLAELGAARIVLGTAAHNDPAFLSRAVDEFGDTVVVGVDAKDGNVALSGWQKITETVATEFARDLGEAGVSRIIYTDILSDGMMQGPNLEATRILAEAAGIPVTASGGVSTLMDVEALSALEPAGVDEVIIGRALYLNVFTLADAIGAAG